MKISRLYERLDRMPVLKLLVPFAAGIALAGRYELPLWFLAGAFVLSGVVALLFRSQAAAVGMLLTAGFAAAQLRAPSPPVPRGIETVYEITIEGFPADRGRYVSADASVAAWRDPADGHWYPSDARVRLYVDSLTDLRPGERLRCRGTVRPFRGGAESYRRLMQRRGYAGTLWVSERTILERLPQQHAGLHRTAVERLARLPMKPEAEAVVEAMAAGERRGITPELRTVYSRSGLSHLLAVSGLHTGIVFVLINAALWWLPLLRRGHLLKNLLAAGAVWLFVAAAGFPPSAVRAAVMCTVLQAALASASEYVGMNALAAAAFGMLLWNPNWFGDISFQLSFLAVAGILAWGVPLCRRCRTRWKALNIVIDAYLIGLIATVATAPLVSHTFGIVPLAGIVVNPLAIALAGVVVFGGALWMLAPVGFLAPAFGFVTGTAAGWINALARLTASLPGGAADYTLGGWQTAVIYLVFALATAAAWSAEPKKSVPLRT
ncbi:ComEC/Rec2 family competence protein [Alistipes provencensis]|uniref:ComEC/Rec2 family competence protein n=1 Tax=Alistipes provencensis TaxID=1816676 RepID=UPI0007ED76A1|nr:ComEC/Rec2 family competence protein [Alistipes provencensis]